jgi:AcrR family transcriptional regulator
MIFVMSDPDHTAARLVSAAEHLFADAGEEGTSLRAITREARSNAAAVHYHFGGRDELLRAVLDRRLGPLHGRRVQLLEAAIARYGEPVPLQAAVEAAVRPDLELLAKLRKHRVQLARFLGRAHTLPGPPVAQFMERQFELMADLLEPTLRKILPELDGGELRQRLRLVQATVFALLAAAPDPLRTGPLGTDDVDEQVRRLVAFSAAGLAAPGTLRSGRRKKARQAPR